MSRQSVFDTLGRSKSNQRAADPPNPADSHPQPKETEPAKKEPKRSTTKPFNLQNEAPTQTPVAPDHLQRPPTEPAPATDFNCEDGKLYFQVLELAALNESWFALERPGFCENGIKNSLAFEDDDAEVNCPATPRPAQGSQSSVAVVCKAITDCTKKESSLDCEQPGELPFVPSSTEPATVSPLPNAPTLSPQPLQQATKSSSAGTSVGPKLTADSAPPVAALVGTWSQSPPHLFCNPAEEHIFSPVPSTDSETANEVRDWSQDESIYLNVLTENDNCTFVGHRNPWKRAQFIFNELSKQIRSKCPNAARYQVNMMIQFLITAKVPGTDCGPALTGHLFFLADKAAQTKFSEADVLRDGIWIPLSVKAAAYRQPRVDISRFVPPELQGHMKKLALFMQKGELGSFQHASSLHKATLLLRGGKYAEAVQLLSRIPLPTQ